MELLPPIAPEDSYFEWSAWSMTPGRCHVRVFRDEDFSVVIASELADNPGCSIREGFEALANAVSLDHKLDPARLCWVEHWGAFSGSSETTETYYLVRFEKEGGHITEGRPEPISRGSVERMIRGAMPPFPFSA